MAMRSLQLLTPPAWREECAAAVQAAARWLATAQPRTTEDRAFQLLGLAWAGSDRAQMLKVAQDLLREQRADGGWSPIAAVGMASDAYSSSRPRRPIGPSRP